MTLTQAILAEAKNLGFALAGVTTPAQPPHYAKFAEWLNNGRHAGMAYLEALPARLRRRDPRLILPECRSVLVLGLPYPPNSIYYSPESLPSNDRRGSTEDGPYQGAIASYAWIEDYHFSISDRLKALTAFIETQTGKPFPHSLHTDSSPILERDLAQRAGLGWIGKNTNLIDSTIGSTFFLAEILLGIDLEISPPFEQDRCGTCRRCLDACPTGCILPDRTLDASRCISYLTIELKGAIPPDLRPLLGGWIFGCDICQQVCPWNRHALDSSDVKTQPAGSAITHPNLVEILSLTPETFNQRYRRSPVKRAKRAGFLRNAAVALGNLLAQHPVHPQRAAAIERLSASLRQDIHPLVRGHAAWALGRAGERKILQDAAGKETNAWVLGEISFAQTM